MGRFLLWRPSNCYVMGKECTRETTVLGRIYNAGLSEWSEKVTEVNSYTAIREEKCGNTYIYINFSTKYSSVVCSITVTIDQPSISCCTPSQPSALGPFFFFIKII